MENKEIWILVSKPVTIPGTDPNGNPCMLKPSYFTNLIAWQEPHESTITAIIDKDCVEFLARSPEDFAEDVPLVSFEIWSKW